MAVIKPFRGVGYNPRYISDIQPVVSQPYDRITDKLQQQYYDQSPYSIVRIIQGQAQAGDQPENPDGPNGYTRAKATYDQWLETGVLIRSDQPVLYAYEQTFFSGGQTYARLGLIAALELTNFADGVVLPHERTHNEPKQDRLRLLQTMQVNTEQILMLYPDPENRVNVLLRAAIADQEPAIDIVEMFEHDVQQRMWTITDPGVIQAIQAEMRPMRNLIIADGHHRYETGLTYRDLQRQAYPDAPANAAFNFMAVTLVSMNDPGLIILPTHREIRNFSATSPAAVLERAQPVFSVEPTRDLAACLDAVNAHPTGHTFGFYGGQAVGYHALTLNDESSIADLIPDERSHAWKSLSVSVLHSILLDQIVGVPREGIEDKSMIRYHRDAQQAVDSIDEGDGTMVFFVSATRMEQIRACAAQGEKMPQKSTDFYPKMISGLTLLPVSPDKRL
ncbi:MAG: DUF1015 domain-containing protein [Anaerolineae bacterium]|nr:DUF1015 domain-containing protein [Anaerolineae bacterium]